ncbi:MAG: MFS transporter [Methanocorpusculum sp.]|nr:MFS transporter [Methanocorpusculum sp.]
MQQHHYIHYYTDLRLAFRHLCLRLMHPERSGKSDSLFTLPVVVLVFLAFMLGTSEFIVIGILPDLAADLNVSLAVAGGLVSLFAFAYAAGTVLLTSATARANRRTLLLALVIVFIFGNLISCFAASYTVLLLSRFVVAGVSGTLISVAVTFANDIVLPRNRPAVIAWIFSGFSIASVAGVPAGTVMAAFWGWRLSFVFICVLSLVLFFLLRYCLPRVADSAEQNIFHQFVLFSDRRILFGILMVVCSSSATYVFYTYLTPIFETEIGIPAAYVSLALMVFGVCSIASNLLSGRIAARKGIAGLRVPFVVQMVMLAVLPLLLGFPAAGFAAILVLGVLMYLMNASIQLHFLDVAAQDYPDAVNLASSVSPVSFNVGIGLGALLGSVVVNAVGLREVGYCGAVLAAGAVAAAVLLTRGNRSAAGVCYR